MKKISKNNVFTPPEGYFDHLADRVLDRRKKENSRTFVYRLAAAFALLMVFSLTLWSVSNAPTPSLSTPTAELDHEIEWLIENGNWGAEDMLSFSENPDAVLEQVVEEEWSTYEIDESELEQELFSY